MTTYYKFLTSGNTGEYSGFDYTAYLPKRGKPGKWLPKVNEVILCKSGYHGCVKADLFGWYNDSLYIIEFRGKKEKGEDKIAAQEMRFVKKVNGWNEKNLRLAAADIVEKISLPIWKKYYPDDTTLEDVIDTVRRYANGKATAIELSAARSAAWSAAESAARSAAEYAAESAAESAAWSAAESAARSAARSAAWSAAWSAARSAAWKIIIKRCGL